MSGTPSHPLGLNTYQPPPPKGGGMRPPPNAMHSSSFGRSPAPSSGRPTGPVSYGAAGAGPPPQPLAHSRPNPSGPGGAPLAPGLNPVPQNGVSPMAVRPPNGGMPGTQSTPIIPSAGRTPSNGPNSPSSPGLPSNTPQTSSTGRARRAYAPIDPSTTFGNHLQPTGDPSSARYGSVGFSPAQPPSFAFAGPPGPPQFADNRAASAGASFAGAAPLNPPSFTPDPQFVHGMQNMGLGGPKDHYGKPVVNLLQRQINPNDLVVPTELPTLDHRFSVSQSPFSICPASYMRTTMNAVPNAPALLEKSKIPLGLIVSPFHQPVPGEAPIPLINPPSIPRCSRCTAYLNPWIKFVNGGSQWRCSICGVENPVPQFFDWDANSQTRVDRLQRSELTHAIVEYQASQDYMARPPQPVVIIFVIDVSYAAVQSGLVFVAAKTILESLDRIPNLDGRTKVAFLTVDGSVHFYNIGSHLAEPEMLVVSDLDDTPYLPRPDDLLVPLAESRPIIEKLLSNLSNMFKSTLSTKNALPRALASAFKLIEKIGGKIVVVQSSLPNVGPGSLESREDPKLLGTPKESGLLQPAILHYKQIGNDFAKAQVSIDLFCAPAQYGDFTTLSGCVRYSGGSAFLYPGFNASSPEDAAKLSTELGNHLALHNGLEAVCRVRVSTGLAVAALHGNFHKSQFDLISLPNVNPTHSFAVQLLMPEALKDDIVCFQAGLLYTTTEGERRIRVITLAVAVTPQLDRVFGEADHIAIAALTVKKGVQHSQLNSNGFAREGCVTNLNGIAGAYKQHATSQGQSSQLLLPENLSLLPALSLGMLKHIAFRTNSIVPTDVRSYARAVLYAASTEFCITALHPRLWALTADAGASSQAELREFPLLNLRAEQVASAGLCLLDNGLDVFLWVGRNVPPQLCAMLFGKGYEGVQYGKLALPVIPNEFNQRVNDFVRKTREHTLQTAAVWPNFYIVKEDSDPSLRMSFLSHLFEDRTESNSSYVQFLGEIREKISKSGIIS